jgi:hypothetical protein
VQRRAAVRGLVDRLHVAAGDVRYLQEKIKRRGLEGDTVGLLAGAAAAAWGPAREATGAPVGRGPPPAAQLHLTPQGPPSPPPQVAVSAEVLALGGCWELLSGEQRRRHAHLLKSPHLPAPPAAAPAAGAGAAAAAHERGYGRRLPGAPPGLLPAGASASAWAGPAAGAAGAAAPTAAPRRGLPPPAAPAAPTAPAASSAAPTAPAPAPQGLLARLSSGARRATPPPPPQ